MMPVPGCDPQVNIIVIGAKLLVELRRTECSIEELLFNFSTRLNVSSDHIILTLDWLYTISAIEVLDGVAKIK
jgi:hypothetical protein